ncbi:EI24 domain-containing protein [Demequina sp. SYSU T00192]|uniref:EI24 domain-containing protein n=1 Tax=Demequina litoralis TaxID=3051660 RepID=A0ABT8G5K2_9MICO|nr:EI24 domain-containing protein [Demequina sp. SYSU T00192]MDN4474416.1 EI24 domain-containing protein [Demequina sp. SYSU T00192]
MPNARAVPARAREVAVGVRTVAAGLRAWARAPRLLGLGVLPGLLVGAVLGIGLGVLAVNVGAVGRGLAGALGLDDGWLGDVAAVTASVAVLAASSLVAVALFATLTLTVGQPFFEAVSRRVDARLDAEPEGEPWWPALLRGIGEGIVTLAISIGVSLLLLGIGLLPVVGSVTAFTIGVLVGGRLLAIELTAYPMARRGIVARRDRVRALRPYRLRLVAFGAAVFLIFLLPLGAVLAMPAAVAGATLLVRDLPLAPPTPSDGAHGTGPDTPA